MYILFFYSFLSVRRLLFNHGLSAARKRERENDRNYRRRRIEAKDLTAAGERKLATLQDSRLERHGTARHGASNAKTLFYVEQLKGGVDDEEEEREASSSSRIKRSRSSVRVLSLCTEEQSRVYSGRRA